MKFKSKDWAVTDIDYTPMPYIAPAVQGASADPPPIIMFVPLCGLSITDGSWLFFLFFFSVKNNPIPFNQLDQVSVGGPVDRRSHHGPYEISGGFPRSFHIFHIISSYSMPFCSNPKGRTGFAGRGVLIRYGPNHTADTVITRFGFSFTQFTTSAVH